MFFLQHCDTSNDAFDELLAHSEAVRGAALAIAKRLPHLAVDLGFIAEAALLHDIGIVYTHAPQIGCYGKAPYLTHGQIGAGILRQAGFGKHALVCERHIGVGLTREEIEIKLLPLIAKDILPVSIEEQIICYVDNFFSKGGTDALIPLGLDIVREKVKSYGTRSLFTFEKWVEEFGLPV